MISEMGTESQMLCPGCEQSRKPMLRMLLKFDFKHSHIQTQSSRLCNTRTKQTVAHMSKGYDIDAESFGED